jgi:hypothetical protein
MRWARAGHIDRIFGLEFIVSQNPLYIWNALRLELYDVLICCWITCYSLTGVQPYMLNISDVIVLEALPPLYNFFRSPERLPAFPVVLMLQVVNRLITPFYWTCALFTLFDSSWCLASRKREIRIMQWNTTLVVHTEVLLFALWICLISIAVMRALYGIIG